MLWFCCATELGFSEDIGTKEVIIIITIIIHRHFGRLLTSARLRAMHSPLLQFLSASSCHSLKRKGKRVLCVCASNVHVDDKTQ